jgi:predicted XRE-type DNA-binding protein
MRSRRFTLDMRYLRGRIDLFSTDALIEMRARLGARVRFTVKPTRRRLKVA